MTLVDNQMAAIVKAQWRAWRNKGPRSAILYALVSVIWYGFAALLGWGASVVLSGEDDPAKIRQFVGVFLFGGFLYWQFVPVLLASTGMALDLKRLLVYPVKPSKLFVIEVILRLSTGIEVMIFLAGVAVGLWQNPHAPALGPLIFLPYLVFNMCLSAGVRDLIARLLAKKGVRELVIFGLVLVTALPQLVLMMIPPETWRGVSIFTYLDKLPTLPLPWTLGAVAAVGPGWWWAAPLLMAWMAAAAWFGFHQFVKGLSWERTPGAKEKKGVEAPGGGGEGSMGAGAELERGAAGPDGIWATGALASGGKSKEGGWLLEAVEKFYRLPSAVLPDPLGILVEKELRFLSRSARFRLVFLMGFSFGLIIWFPLAFRSGSKGMLSENFLVWVSMYASLMLGDVLFWNCFGFDRQAVQAYFVFPVRFEKVLLAKNLTAVFLLCLEVSLVAAVCSLLRIEVTLAKVVEAFAVTMLICVLLLAVGNIMSTRFPRPSDPSNSWRNSSSGKAQLLLLLVYPLIGIPVALAYLARYAFQSEAAFYAALGAGFVVAAMTYYVAMESAVGWVTKEREATIAELSKGEGPFGG